MDSVVAGVSFARSDNDRFSLDGVRLYHGTGIYGSPGATYMLEPETYTHVTSNGGYGGYPESFTVITKDGMTMTYGGSTNSRYYRYSGNTGAVRAWYLSRVEDESGNYAEYEYAPVSQFNP